MNTQSKGLIGVEPAVESVDDIKLATHQVNTLFLSCPHDSLKAPLREAWVVLLEHSVGRSQRCI